MNEIQNLQPQCIWKNFYALTQVPRPSGHLEKIQQFLLDFGKQVGVYAVKDPAGNIHFRKPATPGMENKKGIILQAHMDMVPQKTPESTHNFETDPIEPWIDGEWVKAKGTTLGADNGLGVAAIMAIMEDKTLKHGPIDALVTRDEETGMFGANELPEGECIFAVTAIYANGQESKPATINVTTDIRQLMTDGQPVDVYTIDGKQLRSQVTTLDGLKGIYVVNGRTVVIK